MCISISRQCEDCGKVFYNNSTLSYHRLTVHGNPEKNFSCPHEGCAFRAFSIHEVKKHVLYVHDKVPRPKPPKVPCPDCDKLFSGNFARNMHLRKIHGHTDIVVKEWAMQCSKCPKRFKDKRFFYSHLNRVHGENYDLSIYISKKPDKPRKRIKKQKVKSDSEESTEEKVIEEQPGEYVV